MKCHRNTKNAWRQLVQLESLPLYRLHCRQAVCRSCSGLCCMLQARVMWGSMRTKQGTQEPGGASRGLMLCFIFPLSQTNINKPSSHHRRNHPFINWYFSRLKCRRFTATVLLWIFLHAILQYTCGIVTSVEVSIPLTSVEDPALTSSEPLPDPNVVQSLQNSIKINEPQFLWEYLQRQHVLCGSWFKLTGEIICNNLRYE